MFTDLIIMECVAMKIKEMSIQIVQFFGKKSDWNDWSNKFLGWAKLRGYRKLFTKKGDYTGVDKILSQDECWKFLAGQSHCDTWADERPCL